MLSRGLLLLHSGSSVVLASTVLGWLWGLPCPSRAMARRKQTFIICRSQVQQDSTRSLLCTVRWGWRGTSRYICSSASKCTVKTLSPRMLKTLLPFHRALEGIWEQLFVLAPEQSEICAFSFIFHCYYSSRPLKLNWKRMEATHAMKQFFIGPGGADNLTDLSHHYFLQFSYRKTAGTYSAKHHPALLHLLLGCPGVGEVERRLSKSQPGWASSDKEGQPHGKMFV